jgi:hypothetical protein
VIVEAKILLFSSGLQSVVVCAWANGSAAASSNDANFIEGIMFVVYCAAAEGVEKLRNSFKKQRNKETKKQVWYCCPGNETK